MSKPTKGSLHSKDSLDSAHMTFDWPTRQRSSWLVAGLIFFSLFLHSATFFFFQVKTPRETAVPHSSPTVGLLTPFTPEGQPSPENVALLSWVAAEDPLLPSRVPTVDPANLHDTPYHPSYLTPRTLPIGLPPENATVQFPAPRNPLKLITSATPRESVSETPALPFVTRLLLPPQLTPKSGDTVPQLTPKATKPLQATSLLIGVNDRGEVRYVFPQESSGQPGADAAAEAFFRTMQFTPNPAPVTWGVVKVVWGDDAQEIQPPSERTP